MASENYRWVPDNPPKKGKTAFDGKKLGKMILVGIVAVFLLIGIFTCFYTVDDKQQAVLTTFGKVTDITNPGLHFKLPYGIQKVSRVDVNVYQKIELGYRTQENGVALSYPEESTMITGDYNIVKVDFFVEYKISDPVAYLYSSTAPELILRNLVQSQVRNVVGSAQVDNVLTVGKEEIQMRVKELVMEILAEYDIGLTLVEVRIQDSDPPTQEVIEAFKAVETAKQQAEAVINKALAYQNAQIPNAQAQAHKLTQEAEYLYQARVNEALEKVALFNAMYNEYILNEDITMARMYYEAISEILPGVKLYITTTGEGDVQMLLPLESLMGGN